MGDSDMKIWKQTLLILMMLASLNGSCSTAAPAKTAPSPSSTNASYVTVTPVIANTPIFQMDFSCWPIKLLQEGNDIKGSFVYAHHPELKSLSLDKANGFFAWDLSSFHSEKLNINKEMHIEDSKVSFNGDTVAIVADNNLVFMSRSSVHSFPLPEEGVLKDLGLAIKNNYIPLNGKVVIGKFGNYRETENDYKEGVGFTDTFDVFDPEINEITTHKVFLLDLYMDWHMVPSIYYSPSIKYVLYMTTPTKHSRQYALYDIEKEEVVMVIPPQNSNLGVTGGDPHWMPNADVITAQFHDENTDLSNYYFISLDGKVTAVTNLPDDVDLTSSMLWNPSQNWSPNKRYLVSADINLSEYIWDNQTETLYKPCLPNETQSMVQPQPLWSFDGNYFISTLVFPSSAPPTVTSSEAIVQQQIVKKYILDLANRVIYKLPEDVNNGEFTSLYKGGKNDFLGWVNWETP
jgi:hypothetical protein